MHTSAGRSNFVLTKTQTLIMENTQNTKEAMRIYDEAAKTMVKTNYSERSVEAMFEAEKQLDDAMETQRKFQGLNYEQKQELMRYEADEIAAENAVYDYWN